MQATQVAWNDKLHMTGNGNETSDTLAPYPYHLIM